VGLVLVAALWWSAATLDRRRPPQAPV